jgi:hypothetical protein
MDGKGCDDRVVGKCARPRIHVHVTVRPHSPQMPQARIAYTHLRATRGEQEGKDLQSFNDVCLQNGSSQGQLALTGLFVPVRSTAGVFRDADETLRSTSMAPMARHLA